MSWWLNDPLLAGIVVAPDSVSGIALTKLSESLLIVISVIFVARAGGMTPADLFLGRGRFRLWLFVGIGTFSVFLVLFVLQTLEEGVTVQQLTAWAPWTLVFIFSNGFMEELHFRGLLLLPFEHLLGRHSANLCIALFFTIVHAPVQYAPDILVFLAVLFLLALAWGYVIQLTNAVWGSVIFHAGADLMVVMSIYRTYGAS